MKNFFLASSATILFLVCSNAQNSLALHSQSLTIQPQTQAKLEASVYSIIEEKTVKLPLKGKPTLILFWSTTCGPCKTEMQRLNRAITEGIIPPGQVLAVDVGEPKEKIKAFAQSSEFMFQYFVLEKTEDAAGFNISGTPTLYLFNSEGDLKWNTLGIKKETIQEAKKIFN